MTRKYRILKKTKSYDDGKEENTYEIQVKFLWWWFNAYSPCCYILYGMGGSASGKMLERVHIIFHNKDHCKEHLDKYFNNSFNIKYKGNLIQRRYFLSKGIDIFVNLSQTGKPYASKTTYEGYSSLEYLKDAIDRRTVSKTAKIVI